MPGVISRSLANVSRESPMKNTLACALSLLLLVPSALAVCSVPQPRLVCAEYFASEVVVEATLLRTRAIRDKDNQSVLASVYTLRADNTLRGQIAPTFRIYESNDSGRAGFDWEMGRTYLLFLWLSKPDKAWVLDGCGNSGPLTKSGKALQEIKAIQDDHSGMGWIHGVVSEQGLSEQLPNIHVEATGQSSWYVSKTDARGEFKIEVPAGTYKVRAIKPGLSFSSADLSYEDARKLTVPAGGCAQVQLEQDGSTSGGSPKGRRE
jgi:hypothetical protein